MDFLQNTLNLDNKKLMIIGGVILGLLVICLVAKNFKTERFEDINKAIDAGKGELAQNIKDVVNNADVKTDAVVIPVKLQADSPIAKDLSQKVNQLTAELVVAHPEEKTIIADKIAEVKQLIPSVVSPINLPVLAPIDQSKVVIPQQPSTFTPIVVPAVPEPIVPLSVIAPIAPVVVAPIAPVVPGVLPEPSPAGLGEKSDAHSWSPVQWDLPLSIAKRNIDPNNVLKPLTV